MASGFQQLQRGSFRTDVANALRAAVISGELAPGTLYSAPSLAERFGVSATPVREAMLELVREGLVATVRNKGYRVTEIDEAELDQIAELRQLIEPPLVARAATVIGAEDLPELRRMADAIVDGARRADLVEYTEADRAFHVRLLEYAGNEPAVTVVSELRAHTRLYGLTALVESGQLADSAMEHHAILDAIEQRDKRTVTKLMRHHIAQTRGRWAAPRSADVT